MREGAIIIPARYESSRLPGKPLKFIGNKTMIEHVFNKCAEAIDKDKIFIATDSEIIADHCLAFTEKIILTSDSCKTGTDRVAEASKELDFNFFINVQGDEPFINSEDIKKVYSYCKDNNLPVVNCYSSLTKEEKTDPSVPKLIISENDNLIYISRSPIPFDKKLSSHALYKQVCIYGFSREVLKIFSSESKKTTIEEIEDIEILRFIEKDIKVKMLKVKSPPISVDTLEDLKKANEIYKCMQ